MANIGTVLTKDPPGLKRAPKAPRIFDSRAERNLGVPIALRCADVPDQVLVIEPGIGKIPGRRYRARAPRDETLVATYVLHGMPRQAAEQLRYHAGFRFLALRFWCDVCEAAEGDRVAKERVDYHRWAWSEMRKAELIADDPEKTVGFFER